jgi:iron complex outermembrane receptor protein
MQLRVSAGIFALCCVAVSPALAAQGDRPPPSEDLSNLSIEQLAQIQVRSAMKRPQPLSDAPAAIYVIDHEQIVRSGAVTIPEILRLAPNLQVYQTSPSNWVVTARGLNGDPAAQSFSNKLLVLIDGRTIYTPLFSGVYWDLPDLLPDDIERIEVISGPGATLWGANAVNGVINIVTRNSGSTSGGYVDIDAGTVQQVAGVRYAGLAGTDLSYRAYARFIRQDAAEVPGDGSAHDGWHRLGGGFRIDWTPGQQDTVTFQGDIFGGSENQPGPDLQEISGRDLVFHWSRDLGRGQQFQLQAFYDRFRRGAGANSGSFFADTYDVDAQHSFALGSRNTVVWGGGARDVHYRISGTPNFFFSPAGRDLFLANIFAQDTFALSEAINLTAGIKAEHDPYVGTSFLPDVRLAIKPNTTTLLWAAVSHAVRSPTPFDEDVHESAAGGAITLAGDPNFRTEKLTAYEVGLRAQPIADLSFSLTGFYHRYDDLRTVEVGPGPGFNLYWSNNLAGHSYGVEAWASASPLPWWTLSAGATLLTERLHFKQGATLPQLGAWQNGIDPRHQFTLRSSMDLGRSVMFDLDLRAIGRLHHGDVPAYAELGGRLAWNATDHLTLSLSGQNLLHAHHVEYPGGDAIPRTILAGLQWRP